MSNGVLYIEQIRHSSRMLQLTTEEQCPILSANCGTGVFSGTIKSLVHALGANCSMTKPTSTQLYMHLLRKSTFMIFRRWSYSLLYVLTPTMVYTYMVYTPYNKAKHLVQSSNMHFIINQINSLASNNNRQLPEDQCTVH